MNILITGATGFVGSYLTKTLIENGHHCRCLVRNEAKAKIRLPDSPKVEYWQGDVTDNNSLKGIAKDTDMIFHLAARMGHDRPSPEAFDKFRQVNVLGLQNILEECRDHPGIKKIFHLSSTASYGILRNHIINEQTECHPYTPYQVSKHEADQQALAYFHKGLPVVIIRPCMIYGPGFEGDFLTMAKVAGKGVYPRFGRGKNLAPSLYITDLIDALSLAMDHARTGEIYLIGPETSSSQQQIVSVMSGFFEKNIISMYLPVFLAKFMASCQEALFSLIGKKPMVTSRNIASITFDRILDISKAKTDLGYRPRVPLEQGLIQTLQWYRKEGLI
jgi:nucleoside-diphosphate-sugar epimerase